MELWPAIDLRGGRCVRLLQGDYERETVFGDDPVAMARQFVAAGARRLHIVDLDGAKAGTPVQAALVERIVQAAGVPCQIGGGIRTLETARRYAAAGVARIVVGSIAIEQPHLLDELAAALLGAVLHGIWQGRRLDALLGGGVLHGHAVPEGAADLRRELVMQAVHEVAHVVGHIAEVQVLAPPVAGVEDLLEILAGPDDRLVVRERAVAEVMDRGDRLVGLHDPPGELGQLFLETDVCGHGVDRRIGPRPQQQTKAQPPPYAAKNATRTVGPKAAEY